MRRPSGVAAAAILILVCALSHKASAATSYSQMVARLNHDTARSPFIRLAWLGKSSSGERSVWLVRVADPSAPASRRILILCRQHGDEPVSTEAALDYLDRLCAENSDQLESALKHVNVYIVPMVNPDGADAGTRQSADGADLNRDWGAFREPETRCVWRAYLAIQPQVVLDMHSWDVSDPFHGDCLEAPRDNAGGLAQATRALQRRGVSTLAEEVGQPIAATSYGSDADPALCHRFFFQRAHVAALLFETQPGSDSALFARQVALAQSAIVWLVGDVARQGAWQQVAKLEGKPVPTSAAARLTFVAGAQAEPGPAKDAPLRAAARLAGLAASRVPAGIWWALGIYVLLCAARPVVAPASGSMGEARPQAMRHRTRRRRGGMARGKI